MQNIADQGSVERADQGEIVVSQSNVVVHQRTHLDASVIDVDREIGFQVLVVERDDRFTGRSGDEGHEAVVVASFQSLAELFLVAALSGFQSERAYQQVADAEKQPQQARCRCPECRHQLIGRGRPGTVETGPETIAVVDAWVSGNG